MGGNMKRYLIIALFSFSTLYSGLEEVVVDPSNLDIALQQQVEQVDWEERFDRLEGAIKGLKNSGSLFSFSSMKDILFHPVTLGCLGATLFAGILWQKHRDYQAIKKHLGTANDNLGKSEQLVDQEEDNLRGDNERLTALKNTQDKQLVAVNDAQSSVQDLNAQLQQRTQTIFSSLSQILGTMRSSQRTLLNQHNSALSSFIYGISNSELPQQVAQQNQGNLAAISQFGQEREQSLSKLSSNLSLVSRNVQSSGAALGNATTALQQLQRKIKEGDSEGEIDDLQQEMVRLQQIIQDLERGADRTQASLTTLRGNFSPFQNNSNAGAGALSTNQLSLPWYPEKN